ncbi:MAG: nitric-oxide reductase large subunit [Fermentimonas sp.]|jgi:nitric oxide reductase subunit B|uniref:nitric-oxide reductase large subunit n=1 Tax=Lascolabacillus sp. TaxID=1924068 RepID=UPI001B3E1259|nr:nitric-oxide reductase large subunit [Lascolabacillus sp.]MBP6176026.1 nitric-oxide reductase large subunit [Fermentimonas sp.]MDI9626889.1 nitric-oxide reductase large subunit [Bacteroidota bacterium]MBP6197329.1 nitric-oxide reductase large subunit [Fermentimonas sp.]MBP7104306.1 nitric-oxide reductase large subunit [Fermentimonas sp.]MDD2606719.1 nitric-oxide reductase large subunit [Lascolabacillus sp.]
MSQKNLWIALSAVIIFSFAVLLYYGKQIYQKAPPIPVNVVNSSGKVLFTGQDIKDGQNIWQSMGGQEVGTIWGHGAYVAPDWTADYLHREAQFLLNKWSQEDHGVEFESLLPDEKAFMESRLQRFLRENTYDEKTGNLVIHNERYEAFLFLNEYYSGIFMDNPEFDELRASYAIAKNSIKSEDRMNKMSTFFFWASWACVTNRPGENITYTHNWPPDEQIGNVPTSDLILWTGFSIIMLLVGIGIMIFVQARSREEEILRPVEDPLMNQTITPSMWAVKKYFWIVNLLILAQVLLGVITAHYSVEGDGFYGIDIASFIPYSITRTWHIQLAIFWIATSWLATGLYIAPSLSGRDPKHQKIGVNVLFVALLIVVAGSLIGQWFGVMQRLDLVNNFWFGHQGYEYVDLGRFWQLLLVVGLFLWLALMVRPILPIIRKKTSEKSLLILFLISCAAIALFYAAGLMWGRTTNLAVAEYWRWWVVHLWVEGFFEVFATVVAAFLFVRLGLLGIKSATNNVLFATVIFLSGGILGTFHHLYFTGTPTAVMAVGATFSALEVVPLVIIGFEAYHNYRLSKATEWLKDYKWPIYFLLSVAFWNFLGAGIFGFIINPPIALYYMQGLNTTPVHGHAALFGVYGMLGIGLILFVLRSMYRKHKWNDKLISFTFWTLNIGLLLMVVLSLLPVGLMQTVASVKEGMWWARSAEFMQQPLLNVFKWLRTIGDTIFAIGSIALFLFVYQLTIMKKRKPTEKELDDKTE